LQSNILSIANNYDRSTPGYARADVNQIPFVTFTILPPEGGFIISRVLQRAGTDFLGWFHFYDGFFPTFHYIQHPTDMMLETTDLFIAGVGLMEIKMKEPMKSALCQTGSSADVFGSVGPIPP